MMVIEGGVYAQTRSRRKLAARQDLKSAFGNRGGVNLLVDPDDDDDDVPAPKQAKPTPDTTRPKFPPAEDDEGETEDVTSETVTTPETPKGPSAAGQDALDKLPLSDEHKAAVLDAYTRVRQARIGWNFVLRRDTDRTVLALGEVLRAELDEAVAAEKKQPSEEATRRRRVAEFEWVDWTRYVVGDHISSGYRRRLQGKTFPDYGPDDPALDRRQKKEKPVVLPDDDPTPINRDDEEGEVPADLGEHDDAQEQDEVTDKPRRSGPPEGVTDRKAARKVAKKVDLSAVKAGKRCGPAAGLYTKKWEGVYAGGPEWVRAVVSAATTTRTIGNLQMLMTQQVYWEEVKPDGEPRASEGYRVKHDGVWWFAFSPATEAKRLRWSTDSVRAALDALVSSGLMERMTLEDGRYGPNTNYVRVRWEVVHQVVPRVMKPVRVDGEDGKGKKVGKKVSKKS